jgi:YggT family protein
MKLIEYLLIAYIILGWMIFLGILKNRNSLFFKIYILLMAKIEPILGAIRKVIPSAGGLDFSPIIVFSGLYLAELLIIKLVNIILNVVS